MAVDHVWLRENKFLSSLITINIHTKKWIHCSEICDHLELGRQMQFGFLQLLCIVANDGLIVHMQLHDNLRVVFTFRRIRKDPRLTLASRSLHELLQVAGTIVDRLASGHRLSCTIWLRSSFLRSSNFAVHGQIHIQVLFEQGSAECVSHVEILAIPIRDSSYF